MQWNRWAYTRLVVLVLAFTLAASAIGFWKYAHYRYGGMDLAIYTNVLSNLSGEENGKIVSPLPTGMVLPLPEGEREGVGAGGSWGWGNWYSSIQGSSYLGDHVEPVLLFLIPFFRLWPDPRLLLILQALALGLTAIPIYLLLFLRQSTERAGDAEGGSPTARNRMSTARAPLATASGRRSGRTRERWSITLSALWLLNPLLWNAALFEFHALAFAPLFLLCAAYTYIHRRFWWFLLFLLLSLSVREDIALIVAMFGVVASVDWWRQHRRSGAAAGSAAWVLIPLLFSIAWFVIATRIAAAHSPSGAYKFLVYYGWLRDAASHPLSLLRHFLSIGNLDMVLGLLLPFLLIPLLRPRWLLLALTPLLQILLAEPGGSNVVIELHYGLLFLPALALASIEAINNISPLPDRRGSERGRDSSRWSRWLQRRFPLPRQFAIGLGIATYLAAAWLLGPFPGIANAAIRSTTADERIRAAAYDDLLAHVPPDAPIAAGYAALPHIAARNGAYALPYAYLGVNQYAFAPYELPDDLRYLLLDQRDALAYAVQFPSVRWSAPYAADGPQRLRLLITKGRFGVVAERDEVALLERGVATAAISTIDERYLTPDHPVRGSLVIDNLRDIVVQIDEK